MDKQLHSAVLQEIRAIGLARATDLLGIRGGVLEIKDTDTLPSELSAAIASIEKTSVGLKIKFYDKLKALELLGKYTGLFDEAERTPKSQSNLLQAIVDSAKEDLQDDDLPELQQAAATGDDLVEQAEMETI